MNKLNFKKGFSLIELLVVIAIIGILSAVGITAYSGYTANAKEQAARTQFAQIVSLVNAEVAKCSLGSGNYAWPGAGTQDTCADGIDADTDTNLATYLGGDLGMKNPYNNSESVSTTYAALGTIADPTTQGHVKITSTAGDNVEIRMLVKTGTVLKQKITASN